MVEDMVPTYQPAGESAGRKTAKPAGGLKVAAIAMM